MTAPLVALAFLAGGWVVLCALAALAKCALQLLRRVLVGFW